MFPCDTCIWLSTGIHLLISLGQISYLVSHFKWSEILQKKVQCIKKLTVLTHLFCTFLIKSIWEWERDVKFIGYIINLFNHQYTFLWKIMCMKLSIFESRFHMFSYTWWALSHTCISLSNWKQVMFYKIFQKHWFIRDYVVRGIPLVILICIFKKFEFPAGGGAAGLPITF